MELSKLDALLARTNQRFVCRDTGWPEPGPVKHVAFITHQAEPPLVASEIDEFKSQVGADSLLPDLYSRYGSLRLYCDTLSADHAFHIAHPDQWQELRSDFVAWLDAIAGCEEEEDMLPPWLDDYVVFGEIPHSGNYYLMPMAGSERGKVFLFDHDGFEFSEQGENLAAFLDKISTVNDALIAEITTHTRYSDGSTDVQWIAQEYQFDPPVL